MKKTAKQTQSSGINMKAAFAVVGAGAATLTGLMADLAREGAADAASMEAVRMAVENTGQAFDEAAAGQFLDMMRDTRAIADDELKPALAGLVAVTGDYQKALELSALAADIARGKNISLQSAADLVGKVAQGNLGTLSRYGIVLGENATAEEALAELQKRFAGQAEAYGQTTAGQLEIISLKIGDFRESLGQMMGPAMGVVGMLPGLSTAFSMVGGAVGAILPVFPGLAATLTGTVIPAIGATIVALGPILIPIAAIGAAIGLLALAWTNNWFDIQGKTQAALGALQAWFEGFQSAVRTIWDGITEAIRAAVNAIIALINGLIGAWNRLELRLPGFYVEIPSIDVPGVGRIGGGSLGWPGLVVATPDIPPIPYLAAGGIVTRPTLAVVGERGPEAVLPLSSGGLDALAERIAAAVARRPTYTINASYRYQDERSLRDEIRLLQLLGAAT
jgi:hypothetical protein